MAKKSSFENLLSKIANVFKTDSYVIDDTYVLGGEESESDNPSTILLILNPDIAKEVKDLNLTDGEDILFIEKIKDFKKTLNGGKLISQEEKDIKNKCKKLNKIIKNIEDWKSLDFSEEEIEGFITDGKTVKLFESDENIPSVTISKTLIPLLTIKNFSDLSYQVIVNDDFNELNTLVFLLDTEYFQLYSIAQYINTDF